MPRVSVEITEDLIASESTQDFTKYVSNFFERADISSVVFSCDWTDDAVLNVSFDQESLRIEGLARAGVRQGDRLVLEARNTRRAGPTYIASLYDGSLLFVEHVLDRADIPTIGRLSELLPSVIDSRVRDGEKERPDYSPMRDSVLRFLAEQWFRGPASAERLRRTLGGMKIRLGFDLGDSNVVAYNTMFPVRPVENLRGSLLAVVLSAQQVFGDLTEDLSDIAFRIDAFVARPVRSE